MFTLKFDSQSPVAKHRQIYDQLKTAILTGQLKPGDRLPTQSEFLDRWGAHIVTVSRAMRELIRDGLIVAKPAKGRFVAERVPHMSAEKRRSQLEAETRRYLVAISPLGFTVSDVVKSVRQSYRKGHEE